MQIRVATDTSRKDLSGTWVVGARAGSSGFTAGRFAGRAWSVEFSRAVATTAAASMGADCPSSSRMAKAGSTTKIVMCGYNRSSAALDLNPERGLLGGSFALGGALHTGDVNPGGAQVVLALWTGATVTKFPGDHKHVTVKLASDAGQQSPEISFPRFTATDEKPIVDAIEEQTANTKPLTLTLRATDPDGDDLKFEIGSSALTGSLGDIGDVTCANGQAAARVCSAPVTFTPLAGSNGTEKFSYDATDGFGRSASAIATITVYPPPACATRGVRIASVGNALILKGATDPFTIYPTAVSNLTSYLTAQGYSVTTVTSLPADLTTPTNYAQVWDIRYNDVVLTSGEQATYTSYLTGGGSLFTMGENSGFEPTRDASLISFVATLGGGALTQIGDTSGTAQNVASPFNSPNSITSINYPGAGRVSSPGTGSFITTDGTGGSAVVFSPGTLANATAGTLIFVLDVNFLYDTSGAQFANEQALAKNLVAYLAAPTPIGGGGGGGGGGGSC